MLFAMFAPQDAGFDRQSVFDPLSVDGRQPDLLRTIGSGDGGLGLVVVGQGTEGRHLMGYSGLAALRGVGRNP